MAMTLWQGAMTAMSCTPENVRNTEWCRLSATSPCLRVLGLVSQECTLPFLNCPKVQVSALAWCVIRRKRYRYASCLLGVGVFARKTIPKRTQFGPLEGVIVKQEDFTVIEIDENRLELTLELENGDFAILDTSSEGMCHIL